MPDRQAGRLVGLDQGEGRAGCFRFGAGEAAYQRACERGLAGAEIAVERDDVARAGVLGQPLAEGCGVGLAGERQG